MKEGKVMCMFGKYNKKLTKKENVLNYMLKGNEIDQWKATKYFKATRLSAIIFSLKKEGYNIWTEYRVNAETNCRYAVYGINK